jgi:hypothetical protein
MFALCTDPNSALKYIDIEYSVIIDVELFLIGVYERIYVWEDFR